MLGVVCSPCTILDDRRSKVRGYVPCRDGCGRLLPLNEFIEDGMLSRKCSFCRLGMIPSFYQDHTIVYGSSETLGNVGEYFR